MKDGMDISYYDRDYPLEESANGFVSGFMQ